MPGSPLKRARREAAAAAAAVRPAYPISPGRVVVSDPERFAVVATEYLDQCDAADDPPTLTGLALQMGYAGGSGLIERCKSPPWSDLLTHARARIEIWWVRKLVLGGAAAAGAIFALKNLAGWTDKQEINQTVTINGDGLDGRLAAAIAARTVEGEVIESDG